MATQRFPKRFASLTKSRKYRDRARRAKESKQLQLESLEDRRLMALVPPVILPNSDVLLNDGAVMTVAPKDLNFEFNDILDPLTIANGIRLTRSGKDGVFDPPNTPGSNDVVIVPGFIGLNDDARQVVMRFSSPLPDDVYRIQIIGAGAAPLRDSSGAAFNGGEDYSVDFRLDLGAQIIAVVPQPVRRNATTGQLEMMMPDPVNPVNSVTSRNKIVVYFNDDDLVDGPAGAENPQFYKLFATFNTLDPADDVVFTPTAVSYDPATDSAVLTFDNFGDQRAFEQFVPSDGSRDTAKSFRLRIGTTESRRQTTTTVQLGGNDPGSSFVTATDIGTILTSGSPLADAQGASAQFAQAIEAQSFVLPWPGNGTEPGHRDIPAEHHLNGGSDTSPVGSTSTIFYNFQSVIGSIPDGIGGSQPAFNLITVEQKQRAREIFDLYSRYAGVQFVETANSGLTVSTGDLRVLNPLIPTGPGGVAGLAGGGLAIMDNAEDWNDQYGAGSLQPGQISWFNVAMHEIGHLLGLGHSYDLPPNTIQGQDGTLLFLASPTPSPGPESIFPGDNDIVHLRNLYRPDNKDIDMYRFTLDGAGVFTAEAFAERLNHSSNLDTHITVWREDASGNRELIARNDDYFSKDSFIELDLEPGVYYVGVSASGNQYYDPTVNDSGIGGLTQGSYEVKFDFRKNASSSLVDVVTPANPTPVPEVADTLNVPFDGDADGNPGGTYDFWFRSAAPRGQEPAGAARTLFVDRTAAAGGNGSLANPFNEIDLALAAAAADANSATPGHDSSYDIVRIVGNGGADGNLATLSDNVAYQVGFSNLGAELRDGRSLNVPKDVTVMVEAGAIFHLFRSYVSVGSTAPSIAADRSGGALQILGTPNSRVYFTTNNEGAGGIGRDDNTSTAPPAAGDWGGIAFTTELDRADGRFVHEEIGVFLNYVNHADVRFGGGQVNVDSSFQVVTPISMTDARPTISHNIITRSADAALSANPDSFEETNFQAPRYWPSFSSTPSYNPSGVAAPTPSKSFTLDYNRVGPDIHGNILVETNSANIAVNGAVSVNTSSTARPSAAIPHVVPAGNDRLLVVSVMTDGNTDVSSVTYGGIQLTQAIEQDSGATGQSVEIWYMTSPPVGTANVVVSFAGSTDPSAITATNFTGVYLANPIGATVGASAATGTAISANLTTSSPNSVLFGVASVQGGPSAPFTPGPGVTEQWDAATGADPAADLGAWGGTLAVPAIGSATFSATSSTSNPWGLAVVEIKKLPLIGNSTNALFVRTTTPAGDVLEELTVAGRFDDTDIVHVVQENLSLRGTPSGATLEEVAPPVDLIVSTSLKVAAGSGPGFAIGSSVQYKVVYVDLLGNEGLASATINVTVTDPDALNPDTHAYIQLENLTIPSGDFVGRRLYRRIGGTDEFTLVDLLPAQLTTFVDRNLPRSGELQRLRVRATPSSIQRARLDGSLVIDPSLIVKSDGARIDVGIGANLLAEGVDGLQIIFTSLYDDRYGAGGTFDTPQDNADDLPKTAAAGDWGGIFIGPNAKASIDYAVFAFAGGLNRIEGTFAGFNAIEIHEADARVAHAEFESNADGSGGQAPATRFGRGANAPSVIFVRAAQPVIIENIVHDNEAAFININVNGLNSDKVVDAGRQVGSHFNADNLLVGRMIGRLDNNGPLIRNNRMVDNANNGMIVRGGTLTTEVVMDDTDIVHVVFDAINIPDLHTFGGMRLESSPTESLVVKFSGTTAGITATGRPLEIDDRIGGMLHVLGQPGFPVVLTSFTDDSAGAGFTPDGFPQVDTDGNGAGGGGGGGGGGNLPTGPEVNNGTLIDNDVATATVGHFEMRPGPGGSVGFAIANTQTGVTAQGQSAIFINQDYVFEFLNYIDVGSNGGAISLDTTTVTMAPTLISDDLVASEGTFAGANGTVNWRVESRINDGQGIVFNTLILNSVQPLGNLRFINYLDEDVFGVSDDLLWQQGTPGQANFRLFTLDNQERIGFSQGGVYQPSSGLVNATYDGWAADEFSDLRAVINGAGTSYTVNGNIDTTDLTPFTDPALGAVHGLADVTTAMAWTVSPTATTATITTFLELIPVDPVSVGTPGEWQGITIDQYAHDRNVETILELESPTSDGTGNATPSKAQPLGNLGPHEKSGDETLRLGFTVHGVIAQPSDVDVYSFSAKAGTEIWVDLDRTWHSLNSVVELIDNLGNVLALSQDSPLESLGDGTAGNIGRRMQKTPPYEGVDHFTTNPRDAGMRLVLPGPANSTNTYHIRIRSNGGLTQGAYQAQIRLREVDEFGGSTVRFANIKYAQNGIRVLGQPAHSPLAGEHTDADNAGGSNNTSNTAQALGNLLNSDRGVLSIAGNLSGAGDVDWYELQINYDAIQSIAGVPAGEQWWSTIFDIDYADGFARPNAVISVFDAATGNLVYSSRDSNIADDRPIPTNVADVSDLDRGSSGAADPWIGPVEMRLGTYLVAVSGDSLMPSQLEQYFNPNVANPLVRLEPMDTVQRAVEDHIGSTGGSNIAVAETNFIDLSVNTNDSSIVPWSLHDVTLFVTQDSGINDPNRTLFRTIDPFSGTVETTIAEFSRNIRDIAMHPRGRLYTYSVFSDTGDNNRFSDAQTGNYIQIDPGTGGLTTIGDDTVITFEQDPANANVAPVVANVVPGPARVGEGIHYRGISISYWPGNGLTGEYLGFAVGGRDELANLNDPRNDPTNDLPNILYAFNPDTGIASSIGTDRTGNGVLAGAGTQIVERGILDTLIDSQPSGTVDAISVVEATLVDALTDATTFQIMDDYPLGTTFPEIPPPPYPEPTRFIVRNGPPGPGNPGTTFEFDAGPEALFNINPTTAGRQIRDTQGFTVDGNRVEFDTGPVVFVQGGGNLANYPVGSTLTITDVDPDPLGPGSRPPITQVFEFTAGAATIPGAIPISIAGNPSPLQMAQRIAAAINAEQANQGMTTQAVPLGADGRRISLTNVAIPTINPNSDSDALLNGAPAAAISIQGAIGGSIANAVVVRIEETSLQADLRTSFDRVNQQLNPSGTMPFNSQIGVSGGLGAPNRVTIGFDGNRVNFSGATNTANVNLGAQVFRTVGSQGGITTAAINRAPVPFLAQDNQATIALRMASALQNNGFPAAQPTATAVVVPGSTIVNADQPLAAAAQATGGTITGLATINQTLYAVDDNGGLFRVNGATSQGARLDYINSATDLVGIEFAALSPGPRNVEGGRYENILFAIDTDGELYAFDTTGVLQPVFASTVDGLGNIVTPTSVQTGLTNVHGLAFSNLDYNLFHTTPNRGNDAGHGIVAPHDQSRVAAPGGSSIYFGFESVVRNNVADDQHYAPAAGLNSYNLPGGAHGSIETNEFSLLGYSSGDNPVLYFNYLLDTEQAGHNPTTPVFMRDSFRVFVGGDDGVWHLVGTNNGNRFTGANNDEFDYAPLRVQEAWDSTGSWRQARIPLGDFAGRDNLRLRFDFSTAGSMNVGDYTHLNGVDNTPTNGDELRPVEGHFLRDQHQFTLSMPGALDQTFEFDLGYTLIAPNGAAIPDGARFTVDGITFEFDSNNSVVETPVFRQVAYSAQSTSNEVAEAIRFAILAINASLVQPVIGNRVNLRGGAPGAVTGAASVTLSGPALPPNFIEGAPGVVGGTRIDVHSGMDRAEVFQAMVPVLASILTEGDTSLIKTHNEVIKLIGYRWVGQSAGPFADPIHQEVLGITTALPGDEFGAFNVSGDPNPTGANFPGALRGRANAFEGVYIDDIIIGVSERGEMVTNGSSVTTFTNNPRVIPETITTGDYQLEIRRAAEGGVPNPFPPPAEPRLILLPQIHTNDRLREGRMLDAPIGGRIYDTQTFSLSDGINTLTFEFNDITLVPASGVAPGNVRIDYRPSDTAPTIAQRVVRAVNSAPVQAVLKLSAQMSDGTLVPSSGALPLPSTSNRVNFIGAVNIPNTGGLNFVAFDEQYGDRNLFRDQGQIILYGNEVSNAAGWGILIDNGARSAADGNTPHQGPVRNLREQNAQRLVPGVVVTNNIVYRNGTGGILFSGDGSPNNDSVVPFGRIVNNTLYGNGGSLTGGTQTDVGIRVNNGAGPTLLNNIVANFNLGIDVADALSRTQTVVGGTLYQGNDTNSNVALGGPGDFPIQLANNEPLFVNAAVGNFYLKAQSRAIDSSVDSLLDRPALLTVKTPMGIANSPIISPDRDGVGQLRVDDPSVATPNGFGLNPFKDRGAIDRVDFNGPNSILVNPQDNDSLGVDLDPLPTVVVLKSQILRDFTIRLIDRFDPDGPAEGSDIDDTTVDTSKVRVEVITAAGTQLLVEGIDYTFSYDTTNNLIRLTPLGGLWPLVRTYRITLDNSAASGISDRAGNILAPNQPDGTHIYTIFLGSAVDFGDAPDSYGTLQASSGPSHQIVGGIHLGATNGADTDGQPSPAADLDASDDGVTFGNLQPGGAVGSSSITVVSSAVGKLDAWFDLDQDGVFDPNEYVLQGVDLVVGSNLITFSMPDGQRGDTYARFRMSTTGITSPLGLAPDGEVEDYLVTLIGPEFQNGAFNIDVNNDGFGSPIDALLVITYLFTWGPLVEANGFANIPLPPRTPEFDAPVPVLDATGGGVPGEGRFIDVNGDGFLSASDALEVINYLNNPPAPAPLAFGAGEGEGEAPEASLVGASSPDSPTNLRGAGALDSAALLVAPDIVIEEVSVGPYTAAESADLTGDDDVLNLAALAVLTPLSSDEIGQSLRLSDQLDQDLPIGPLDEPGWDDLLGDLALDSAKSRREPSQAR